MSEVDCTRLVDADRPVKAQLMSPLTAQSYRSGYGPSGRSRTQSGRWWSRFG